MAKPKWLYHGSPHKLIGYKLMPLKGQDSEDRPENNQEGVYATDKKEVAIAMAIVSSKGVIGAGLDDYVPDKSTPGIIHFGKIKQKYVYLYTLSSKGFKETPLTKNQYISKKSVKPLEIEKLEIDDYKHLIRYSGRIEREKWKKKYMSKKSIGRNEEIKLKRNKIKKV